MIFNSDSDEAIWILVDVEFLAAVQSGSVDTHSSTVDPRMKKPCRNRRVG
jgi:hypothetical protein